MLPFFDLVLVHNRGVTFGLLVWLVQVQSRLQAAALGLVIGGALGNLVDRLRHGAVTDFLDFHF
ncbi:signal peptidase II [Skermanella aerolata]|uniref:signal peptidase II n=1 Tax=Skermanella aerolata TaxID=393310 RepID=UPI00268B97AF